MSWNICKHPECESYTARPDGDYCESCRRANAKESTNEKKSIEKRNSQIAKAKKRNQEPRKLPNKVSSHRLHENVEYLCLRAKFLEENPNCKAKANGYCTGKAEDVHHKRGRIGKNLLDTTTFFPVCRSCHSYIEGHPKEARQKGWSESRLATTEPHKI